MNRDSAVRATDIGAGVPTEGNTHQVADDVKQDAGEVPDVRVVYVDIWRSRADIATLLADFQLVEPGWTWTTEWHPEETEPDVRTVTFRTPNESVIWAGVGQKVT